MSLLGLPAIKGLHLISVFYNLECYPTTAIKKEFPSSFTGLGTLQDDYEIQVKQDAQPFCSDLALLETSHYLFVIR